MGFLNQSMAQARDLFASMTPAARITAALLLGVIGVSLGYLFQDYHRGSKEYLLNGETLQGREVDAMEAAIARAGLSDYERQGNRLLVPRGEKAAYLAAVANEGALPANLDTLLIDESDNLGLFTDRKTRDDRMKALRERAIAMMVREMDGVADANVLLGIQESQGFQKRLITATVSVRPAPGEALTPRRQKMIRAAVAGATGGLDMKDVVVVNLADGSQFEDGSMVEAEAFDDPYFQTRVTYERMMKRNIEEFLQHIPGISVQVTAELDETLSTERHAISSEGDTKAIVEETDQSLVTDTQVEDRGPPGLTAQGPGRTGAEQAVAKNEHRTETNTREASSFVPTTTELLRTAGLVPKDVRVAIGIPSDFIVKVWRERNPDAAPTDRPSPENVAQISGEYEDNIIKTLAGLLPFNPTEDAPPKIQVAVFQSLSPAPPAEPSVMSEAMMWASGNSGALIMAGLALVSLVMLRGMVKGIPTPETNVVLTMPGAGGPMGVAGAAGGYASAAGGGAGGGGPDLAGGGRGHAERERPKLRLKKGASLKDDLTEMVREDPDAAAAILRTWISNAS
ncbi:MAG TPA: hypothetical protein VEQ85_11160 [Lacipirellulaceae bacterium]|nr:hypothetical protein [Lacipirellulaceae bacterium]